MDYDERSRGAYAGRRAGVALGSRLVRPGVIEVRWDHADTAHVDSHNGYEVRYRKKSVAEWTINDDTPALNVGGTYDYEFHH